MDAKHKMKNKLMFTIGLAIVTSVTHAGVLLDDSIIGSKTVQAGDPLRLAMHLTDQGQAEKHILSYQWFSFDMFGPSVIPDATNRVLTIDNAAIKDATYYAGRVTDGTNTDFSILYGVEIQQQGVLIVKQFWPDGNYPVLANEGDPVIIKVKLTDAAQEIKDMLTYQWYVENPGTGELSAITGATKRTYNITSTQVTDVGYYICSVSDGTTTEYMPEPYDIEIEFSE